MTTKDVDSTGVMWWMKEHWPDGSCWPVYQVVRGDYEVVFETDDIAAARRLLSVLVDVQWDVDCDGGA